MLAVLPISRCLVEQEIEISGALSLHPPGDWGGISCIGELPSQDSLTGFATITSGISPEVIESSTLVVFDSDFNDALEVRSSHKDDLFLLQRVVAECESQLDVVRFDLCRLDLPDTLPGRVGTWDQSNGASGCVFIDPVRNASRFVGGRYLVSTLTAGIGLDFDAYRNKHGRRQDEIGNVVKQVLRLFRHALEAGDWTSKYMHCVQIFEVLADPFQLTSANKWERVRARICAHIAKDKQGYEQLASRFRYFGNIGENGERGLRERLFHHGELLENIFDSSMALRSLFNEVQSYLSKVVNDLMQFDGTTWQQVNEWRDQRLSALGAA